MGQFKIKDHLSPAEAEIGAKLGNIFLSGKEKVGVLRYSM